MPAPTTTLSPPPNSDEMVVVPEPVALHYPKGSIEGYEERQVALSRLSRRWAELNPHLLPFDPAKPKIRGVTLAAKNARILLKRAYPGTVFRVTSDKYSSGASLDVEWVAFNAEPSPSDVRERLNRFATGRFDGSTDSYEYDDDLMHEAFRKTFGSATLVSAQTLQPSPEQQAAHEQKVLRETLAVEPMSPVGQGSRPARRL